MKINVTITIPDGGSCYEGGYCCPQLIRHTDSRQGWCRVFDADEDVDIADFRVIGGQKCKLCRELCAIQEAAK